MASKNPARREGQVRETRVCRFLAFLAGAATLAILVAGCPRSGGRGPGKSPRGWGKYRTLRVASFGGSVERQARLFVGRVVESMTGATVEYVKGTSRSHFRSLLAAKGKTPPFDVVYLDGMVQDQANRSGVLAQLSLERHPFVKDLDSNARVHEAYGPGVQFYSTGICYSRDILAENDVPPLARWADLWKYPKLRGRVAVPNISHTAGVDFLLVATRIAGGDPTRLEDLKKGVEKIRELEPAVVYKSLSKLRKAFEGGKVWVAPLYNSRAFAFVDSGLSVEFLLPRDKGFGHVTGLCIAEGTANRDLAEVYLNVAMSPAVQLAQAVDAPYGPTNTRVFAILGAHPNLTCRFPLGQDDFADLVVPNWKPFNAVRDELETTWYALFPSSD